MIAFTFISCDEPEAHKHSYKEEITKAPTCTEDGEKTFTCVCGESYKEEMPALGHSINDAGTCTRCNKEGLKAAKIGNVEYTSLAEAIEKAESGSTITLLCDSSGRGLGSADGTKKREGLVIDFAGHTYTMVKDAVGSVGYETQAMHWGTSLGAVTMINGTFNVAENAAKMAMQNYINFTAEDMKFDFSIMEVISYGETEFSGANAIYNGLEVPMFNNNQNNMILKNCTVIMPEKSSKGISADGKSVTLEDTIIDGYINLQDATSILYVKGKTSFKDVVPYFKGAEIVKVVKEDKTIYKVVTIE